MKEKRSGLFRSIRLIILLIFAAGMIVIALYPFANRNLKLKFLTDNGVYTLTKTNAEISEQKQVNLTFEQLDALSITELVIYGNFDSMFLKKVSHSELAAFVAEVGEGTMEWQTDRLKFTGNGNIELVMTETFQELLRNHSASFLQERLLIMELFLALIILAFMVCKAIEEKLDENNRDNHGPIYECRKFIKDIERYGQYMVYAAETDLKAEVANSYLNRLWWLLEPFFNMVVYVVVFGKMMGNSVQNYATFVFSALLMWNFFSKTINYSVKLVRNNKDIVTKVYVPKFILLLSNMILNMFKLLFSLIVLVVMMVIFRVQISFNLFWVLPAYVVMILLAFGAGMIFLHFGVYVDDLSYAVGILLNMLMFLSGIFYEVMITLPEPLNVVMMCLNPVAMFVDTMRNALLYNTATNLPILGIWFLISVILCCIGVHTVYKNENGYVKVV